MRSLKQPVATTKHSSSSLQDPLACNPRLLALCQTSQLALSMLAISEMCRL
ncbi:hypothetical protein M3J09_001158 [Ascochyta lentis]